MSKRLLTLAICVVLVSAAVALWLQPPAVQGNVPISLPDALAKKLVTINLSGTSQFFKQGAAYDIWNLTNGDLILVLPTGLLLPPDDSSQQTLMVTQPATLTLKAKETAGGSLATVCTQVSKDAPGYGARLTVGGMATGNLVAAANVIARHKWNNTLSAQLAVWRITDNITQEDVTSRTQSQTLDVLSTIARRVPEARDPFILADTILEEAGTGLHF